MDQSLSRSGQILLPIGPCDCHTAYGFRVYVVQPALDPRRIAEGGKETWVQQQWPRFSSRRFGAFAVSRLPRPTFGRHFIPPSPPAIKWRPEVGLGMRLRYFAVRGGPTLAGGVRCKDFAMSCNPRLRQFR